MRSIRTEPRQWGLMGQHDGDISPMFVWNRIDAEIGAQLAKLDKSPRALKCFRNNRHLLSDYAYWFFLSTMWVSYTGLTELAEWKRYFSADRPHRDICLMKPSELQALAKLPEVVTVYRAHRPGEVDWIAYTTNPMVAVRFALKRGVSEIAEYQVNKTDILAYFTRRNEFEVLVLDRSKTTLMRVITVVRQAEGRETE